MVMTEELRLYSFVNMYLSPIQAGIQTGHMTDNMSVDYLQDISGMAPMAMYADWIRSHKTYIILNGGDYDLQQEEFIELKEACKAIYLPYGKFNEPGLGRIMTCYGAVIPAHLFNATRNMVPVDSGGFVEVGYQYADKEKTFIYVEGSPEFAIIKILKSHSLFK